MVLRRQRVEPVAAPVVAEVAIRRDPSLRSLAASAAAIKLDATSLLRKRITDQEWQRESWRHYDLCGEFRFASGAHAAALSRCVLQVVKVDKRGRPGDSVDREEIAALGEAIFGGPAEKAEGLRTMGLQLFVAGEGYLVAEGGGDADVWYVVTPMAIKRVGGQIEVIRPENKGGGRRVLNPQTDLLMRVWNPHPRDGNVADAPARAALPILREIERLSMLAFSQIDSRLVSAGLLLLPQGTSFPDSEGTDKGVRGLYDMIIEVARAQLSGAGTAAGVVPIVAEVPEGTGNEIKHLTFATPLGAEIVGKLDHAIRRLALSLDMNPEDLLGKGGLNHWSAWSVEESTIKLFIEPAMARICAALTEGFLRPALEAMGEQADEYTIWFDASPLTVRPNRFEDATLLFDKGELSAEEMRTAGNFDSGEPTEEERSRWMVWELVKLNPQLASDPVVAEVLGLPAGIGQAAFEQQAMISGVDPATGQPIAQPEETNALPDDPGSGASPAQSGEEEFAHLLPAAELLVFRALELAGGRMLDRSTRGKFASVARHDMHTRVRVENLDRAHQLMEGAWAHVPRLALDYRVSADELQRLLSSYCAELLTRGYAHDRQLLAEMLRRAGVGRAAIRA